MDFVNLNYQEIIEKVINDYADFLGNDAQVQIETVFDRSSDRYLLIETGWQDGYRIYGTLLHMDIIDNKIWVQHDGTEEGIANDLLMLGVPKSHIVLGFKSRQRRQITEFAVS
jgi:hypothetical protein